MNEPRKFGEWSNLVLNISIDIAMILTMRLKLNAQFRLILRQENSFRTRMEECCRLT